MGIPYMKPWEWRLHIVVLSDKSVIHRNRIKKKIMYILYYIDPIHWLRPIVTCDGTCSPRGHVRRCVVCVKIHNNIIILKCITFVLQYVIALCVYIYNIIYIITGTVK